MRNNLDIKLAFGGMALLLVMVGFMQSWGVALAKATPQDCINPTITSSSAMPPKASFISRLFLK